MFSLSNAILFWSIRTSEMMENTIFSKITIHLMINKLSSIISSENFQECIKLFFHISFKQKKGGKDFTLNIKRIDLGKSCEIINKQKILFITSERSIKWSPNITMHKRKWLINSRSRQLERQPLCLSNTTRSAS